MVAEWLLIFVIVIWMSFYYNYFLALWGIVNSLRLNRKYGTDKPSWFVIQITTAGKAPKSVISMLKHLKSLDLKFKYEVWVVTEPRDHTKYNCDRLIVVPPLFKCNSAFKARALEYARRLRLIEYEKKGIDPNKTKVLFLDDDCFPDKKYVEAVYYSNLDIGQGRLQSDKNYGFSLIASIADNFKATDCFATCSTFGAMGKPVNVHGEGLFARGSVENYVTWEIGGEGSWGEDFTFGTKASKKYKFGVIPYVLHESSLLSVKDLYKQRRRWYRNNPEIMRTTDNWRRLFIGSRIFSGYCGLPAVFFTIYLTIVRVSYPPPIYYVFTTGTVFFVSYYLIGAWINTHSFKKVVQTLFLFWIVAIIESTFLYLSLIFKPKGFEVTPKDLPINYEGS